MPPVLPAWDVSKPNLQGPSAQQGSAPTSRQLVALPGLAFQQPAAPVSTFDSQRCPAFQQATAAD